MKTKEQLDSQHIEALQRQTISDSANLLRGEFHRLTDIRKEYERRGCSKEIADKQRQAADIVYEAANALIRLYYTNNRTDGD